MTLRGAPRWYYSLFFNDVWERFGFYTVQAILVLYASTSTADGGLGLARADAASLFGAWLGFTFMMSLVGGWIGDRVLGPRRALLIGIAIITLGYLSFSVPVPAFAVVGLVALSVGTALYKPNHQAMINLMSGGSRGRRESAISLMYVGIQCSALFAPLITGFVGETISYNLGFFVAFLVLTGGTIQFARASNKFFGDVGAVAGRPLSDDERRYYGSRFGVGAALFVAFVLVGAVSGVLTPETAIILVGMVSLVLPVLGYFWVRRQPGLEPADQTRLKTFIWVFLGSALFWSVAAQDGSVLTLFARDSTNRMIGDFEIPASWMQMATPVLLLLIAPLAAKWLPRMGTDAESVPRKFSIGLLLAGAGFLVMAWGAQLASDGTLVSPMWVIATNAVHACGELIVAAVGISAAADVLPRRYMSSTLGLLWLFAALGGGLGSQVVRLSEALGEVTYFLSVGSFAAVIGIVFWFMRHTIARGLSAPRSTDAESAIA